MRKRLRETYTAEQLAEVYRTGYNHKKWVDHRLRIATSVTLGRWLYDRLGLLTVGDMSCGDAAIPLGICRDRILASLGDYVANDYYDFTGDIMVGLDQMDPVDLYVCSETIEHVDDPDSLLERIRSKTRYMLLSTPDGEWEDINPEHYWGWDQDEIAGMLGEAGFSPLTSLVLDLSHEPQFPYRFQMWLAEAV